MTITGTNFITGATVSFGGTAATGVSVVSPTSITATSPATLTAGTVDVDVTTSGGTSSNTVADDFTYNAVTPTVTAVNPISGNVYLSVARGRGPDATPVLMRLVADGELRNETADRVEDRVERVAVAGEDHPRGERAGSLAAEDVEGLVDDVARIGFAGAGALDRCGDTGGDRFGDRTRKLALQSGGGAEVVEEIGMGAADLGGDGLERDRLRAVAEEQAARGLERGGPARFRAEASAVY